MSFGAPNLIAGLATITIDGNLVATRANCVVSPDPVEREGIAGQDRVHGYREIPRVPFVESDLSLQQTQAVLSFFQDQDGASTVVVMMADGRTFQLSQAWYRGASEVQSAEGQWRARWEGFTCQEVLAAAA